ncbi:MAG TPA: hypothetical protein VII61_05200 [Ktedonobacteraceae bacterium]
MYSTQMLLAANIEDASSEDEIDELFSQLLQIEPPATLVDDILATVARLPLPQEMDKMTWEDVQGLIARNKMQMPS